MAGFTVSDKEAKQTALDFIRSHGYPDREISLGFLGPPRSDSAGEFWWPIEIFQPGGGSLALAISGSDKRVVITSGSLPRKGAG